MVTVVVGGFFGDEGKGKIVAYLSLKDDVDICVRTGAPNAGHTVVFQGKTWKLRIIPSGFINRKTRLLIAPGALIRLDILFKEVNETESWGRVGIDERTGVIEDIHVNLERSNEYLMKVIGSTGQGVGMAMVDRILRKLKLARDFPELKPMLTDVVDEVNEAIDKGLKVLIEGTQGTFLSLYHGTYPHVTSRDVTACGVLSEVGIGPKKVRDVIVVFKAYVTRVGSGYLPNELPIDEVKKLGWVEYGTVTGRLRRVAPFNLELAKRAVVINSATQVALTKIDALFPEARGKVRWNDLPLEARKWIENIENELKTPITLIGTGEDVSEIIDLRKEKGFI